MSRAVFAGCVMAAVVACKGDNQPTSPVSATNATDGLSISEVQSERQFELSGKPHQSNDIEAVIAILHNRGHFRTCNGTDGASYAENHQINTGTVTGDPRLTGNIEMHVTEIVHFGDDVWTPSFGTFVVRDPASGQIKADGDYDAWAHADVFEGTIVGHVRDASGQEGGNLIANVSVVFGENGSLSIRVGGVSPLESRMNAGIFDGKCSGPWTEYDSDVPPPTAASAARIRSLPTSSFWQKLQR